MNPKNNRKVLFNFFRPHLPIKAEQTHPATCPASFTEREGAYGTHENFTLTQIIKNTHHPNRADLFLCVLVFLGLSFLSLIVGPFRGIIRCRFKRRVILNELQETTLMLHVLKKTPKAPDQNEGIDSLSSFWGGQSGFTVGLRTGGPVNGYCSICIWFPAGRRAEIRAESENTWRGSEDQRTTTHTAERSRKPVGTCVKKWIE